MALWVDAARPYLVDAARLQKPRALHAALADALAAGQVDKVKLGLERLLHILVGAVVLGLGFRVYHVGGGQGLGLDLSRAQHS